MRLAFFGDVHGNLEALNAVLEDIQRRGVDEIFCLGDLVGYGPDPEAVVQLIREKTSKLSWETTTMRWVIQRKVVDVLTHREEKLKWVISHSTGPLNALPKRQKNS